MLRALFPLSVSLLLLATPADPGAEQGSTLSWNGLSPSSLQGGLGNHLGYEGLGFRGSTYNGLSADALVNNAGWTEWYAGDDGNQELFSYLVGCALAPDQRIGAVEVDGTVWGPWAGTIGLAPAWANGARQTQAEQDLVSACLLAHVNAYGVSVPISVRGGQWQPSSSEIEDFPIFEGQFFGSVFNDDGDFEVCRAGGESNAATSEELLAADRICTIDPAQCSLVDAGPCARVCTDWDEERGAYGRCGGVASVATYIESPWEPLPALQIWDGR